MEFKVEKMVVPKGLGWMSWVNHSIFDRILLALILWAELEYLLTILRNKSPIIFFTFVLKDGPLISKIYEKEELKCSSNVL